MDLLVVVVVLNGSMEELETRSVDLFVEARVNIYRIIVGKNRRVDTKMVHVVANFGTQNVTVEIVHFYLEIRVDVVVFHVVLENFKQNTIDFDFL